MKTRSSRIAGWAITAGGAFALLGAAPTALADGAALYEKHCGKCHGSDGKSETAVGKAMKASALAGGTWPAESVNKTVRENPKHKSISGSVSDSDLDAIVKHLESL
jgi:mono/diheme cytochrome c family protein